MISPVPCVCLITPGHVASAPRVVKEADALAAAGFRTHVVSGRTFPPLAPQDAAIFSAAGWTSSVVDCLGRRRSARQLMRRGARLALRCGWRGLRVAARSQNADTSRFVAMAAAVTADLYIGHCLAGLPAAALAANARHSRYGFDAEDFHDAETDAVSGDGVERITTTLLQRRLLSGCSHLTAASPLIGEHYRRDYNVAPTTVLNVFPRTHAPAHRPPADAITERRPAILYWFSQTIGPGRGLEAIVQVMARMKTPAELHLRGFPVPGYAAALQTLATQVGARRPIVFLPPGPPAEMARLAATADLGLSLEQAQPLNRDLCLTNKVFVYLLAGIPQLLSPTAAQRALASEFGAAALLSDPNDAADTATALDAFFTDAPRIAAARHAAWELAQKRFCWDIEQKIFLDSVHHALSRPV